MVLNKTKLKSYSHIIGCATKLRKISVKRNVTKVGRYINANNSFRIIVFCVLKGLIVPLPKTTGFLSLKKHGLSLVKRYMSLV